MRILIALALLPVLAQAANGIYTCPSAPVGGGMSTCSVSKWPCLSSVTNETLVRTIVGTQSWQRWSTVPPSGAVSACVVETGASVGWTTRQASGVATTGSTPEPPSPPPTLPPSAPAIVSVGDLLWWTPEPSAVSYRVYQGKEPGVYGGPVGVTTTRYPLKDLPPGRYYFAVSAVYADGTESAKTAAVEPLDVPEAPPPTVKQLVCDAPVVTGMQVAVVCRIQ